MDLGVINCTMENQIDNAGEVVLSFYVGAMRNANVEKRACHA